MSTNRTTQRDTLLAALREYGPMTASEMAEMTGLTRHQVHSYLCRTRNLYPRMYFVIKDWQRRIGATSIAPIYKAGPGRDVPAPDLSTKEAARERQERYRGKHSAELRIMNQAKRGSALIGDPFAQLYTITGAAAIVGKDRRPKTKPQKEN